MFRRYFYTGIVAILLLAVLLTGCGNDSATDVVADVVTKADIENQKKVIQDYYGYINNHEDKDYEDAYELTSKNFQSGLSFKSFIPQYKECLDSVKVNSVEYLEEYTSNNSWAYNVSFDAVYKKQYSSGDGNLPPIHVIIKEGKDWKIDSIGMGAEDGQ